MNKLVGPGYCVIVVSLAGIWTWSHAAWAGAKVVQKQIAPAAPKAASAVRRAGRDNAARTWSRIPRRISRGAGDPGDTSSGVSADADPIDSAPATAGSENDAAGGGGFALALPATLSLLPAPPELGGSPSRPASAADVSSADESFAQAGTGLRLGVRTGVVRRSLDFTQDIYQRLRALRATQYVYRIDAVVFPSFLTQKLAGRIGLVARYEGTYAGSVRDADFDSEFGALYSELFGGLRVRHPVRAHTLGFDLTAGRLKAGLDDRGGAAGVPDVSYTEARAAIDGTVNFDPVRATASAGFRVPLGYGELSSAEWFPRVGGYGIDASLLVSYRVAPLVGIDVSTTLRRFVLEMNSEPEDGARGVSEIAGGAIDSYVGAYVGVSFVL